MGSTLHFNFPVYSDEDKPSILHDYNTTITAIDNILYQLSIATGSSEEYEGLIIQLQEQVAEIRQITVQNSESIVDINATILNIYGIVNQLSNKVDGFDAQFEAIEDALKDKLDKVTENSFPVEPVVDQTLQTMVIDVPYTEKEGNTPPDSIKGFVPSDVFMYTTVNAVKFRITLPDESEWVSDYELYPWAFYRGLWVSRTYTDEQEVEHLYWTPYFLRLNQPYQLPTASANVLGGIKVGANLSIDENGVLSAQAGSQYVLPIATASDLGGIKVGTGLTIDPVTGVLDNDNPTPATPYVLPTADANTLGGVKIGSGVSVAADGTISVSGGGSSIKAVRLIDNSDLPASANPYHIIVNPPTSQAEAESLDFGPMFIYTGTDVSIEYANIPPFEYGGMIMLDNGKTYSTSIKVIQYQGTTYYIPTYTEGGIREAGFYSLQELGYDVMMRQPLTQLNANLSIDLNYRSNLDNIRLSFSVLSDDWYGKTIGEILTDSGISYQSSDRFIIVPRNNMPLASENLASFLNLTSPQSYIPYDFAPKPNTDWQINNIWYQNSQIVYGVNYSLSKNILDIRVKSDMQSVVYYDGNSIVGTDSSLVISDMQYEFIGALNNPQALASSDKTMTYVNGLILAIYKL